MKLLSTLCLTLMLLVPTVSEAVTFLSETFEYGSRAAGISALTAKYGCSYGTPTAPAPWVQTYSPQYLDDSDKFAGSFSLRQVYTGSQYDTPSQGGGACEFDFDHLDPGGTDRKDIWITWYHKLDVNWQGAGGGGVGGVATKGLYMYMKSLSTGSVHGWVFHYFYGGNVIAMSAQGIKDARGPASGGYQPVPYDTENMWSSYNQPEGHWVCYQANYRLNTPGQADGRYLLYAQNMTLGESSATLVASYTNREFLDTTPGGLSPSDSRWFRFKFYRQDGLGYMWYDNVTVSSTAVGCNGTPPPGDTTAPPVPQAPTTPSQTLPLTVNWTGVTNTAGDLLGYKYYRKLEPCWQNGSFTLFATLGNVLTYSDTTVPNSSTNVCIKVSSYDTTGNESGLSNGTDVSLTPPAASVRNTTVTDTFSAGNSNPLPSPWVGGYVSNGTTTDVNFQVLSGAAAPASLGFDAAMTRNETTPNDQWACEEFTSLGADYPGILLRFAAPPTKSGYEFRRIADGTVRISKWTNGTHSNIQTVTGAFASNDTLCGEAEGTALRLYKTSGGVSTLMHSVTDSTYTSGYRGFITYNGSINSTLVTAFTGGDFDSGTPTGDTFSTVATYAMDATGGDLTFNGLAYKIRYWNDLHPRTAPVEVTGLGGVSTYRLSKTWETDPTAVRFSCVESQGSDGVWETVNDPDSYVCDSLPLLGADSTAPAAPTGFEVR